MYATAGNVVLAYVGLCPVSMCGFAVGVWAPTSALVAPEVCVDKLLALELASLRDRQRERGKGAQCTHAHACAY